MDLSALLSYPLPDRQLSYEHRDVILYALGLGCGADVLGHVFEDGLRPLPFYGLVLGHPGFWLRDPVLGIDWVRILHADQSVQVLRDLPASGKVTASFKVVAVADKGPEKGAIIYVEKTLSDEGGPYCTMTQGIFCRGDGGCGDYGAVPLAHPAVPETAPDRTVTMDISPRAAAIYRLSGDLNPLHIDPAVAQKAGFDRPILHGLCTFGMAGRALMPDLPGFGGFSARFSAPVYPGETLQTDIWTTGEGLQFRATIPARGVTVLDRGRATKREG